LDRRKAEGWEGRSPAAKPPKTGNVEHKRTKGVLGFPAHRLAKPGR